MLAAKYVKKKRELIAKRTKEWTERMSKRDLHNGMNKTKWPTGVTVRVQPLVLTRK